MARFCEGSLLKNWWTEFFSREVAEAILSELRPGELDFLMKHLQLDQKSTVFDQCCGWGRVAGPLSKRVGKVWGIDDVPEMVEAAKERWAGRTLEVLCTDAFLHVQEPLCDGAINLYSSFGYTSDTEKNFTMLQRLAASVKPGRRFVLDTINPWRVYGDFQETMETETPSGIRVLRESRLDKDRKLLHQKWKFLFHEDRPIERYGVTKLYDLEELRDMVLSLDCEPLAAFGDFSGSGYTDESERLILLARR